MTFARCGVGNAKEAFTWHRSPLFRAFYLELQGITMLLSPDTVSIPFRASSQRFREEGGWEKRVVFMKSYEIVVGINCALSTSLF